VSIYVTMFTVVQQRLSTLVRKDFLCWL